MSTLSKPETTSGHAGKIALGVFLGLACYAAFAAFTGDLDSTLSALESVPLTLIASACGLSFLNYLIRFPRWERYRGLVGVNISRSSSLIVYLSGLSLTVTPGKVGEAFKSVLIRKLDGTPIHKTAPIVLAERVTDLLGFLVLIMLASLAGGLSLDWIFWTAASACLFICVPLSSPGISRELVKLSGMLPGGGWLAPRLDGALTSARALLAPRELTGATLLAALGWGLECLACWLLARHFAPDISPAACAHAFAVAAVAGAVVVFSPGGLGVTEASLFGLLLLALEAAGLESAAAAAAATTTVLLARLCTLWFAVLVGVIATMLFSRLDPASQAPVS
jgi:glycosyltransferase 2 family protein